MKNRRTCAREGCDERGLPTPGGVLCKRHRNTVTGVAYVVERGGTALSAGSRTWDGDRGAFRD